MPKPVLVNLTDALLRAHEDARMAPILRSLRVQGFVPISDEHYDAERRLLQRCEALAVR